jgi:tape measure domain-containing protein
MILDESGFSAGINSAVKKLEGFDGEVAKTGKRSGSSLSGIWTSFVGNFLASGASKIISKGIGMITSSLDGAINRVDTLNNSNRVFENMGFSANETKRTMENLKKSIQGLPTPLDGAIKGVQLIASSTNDLGKSQEIFAALNNGILGFGGSAEMVDNAIIQLSQSFSNGKVDAQTWNSMINSGLGPALNALAKQMGLTAGQLKSGLSEGAISVAEFQDSLIKLNKEGGGGLKSLEQIAKDSTSGIKTGIANMKTAITRGVANVISSFDKGLQAAGFGSISDIIADKGTKIENMLNRFAEAIPGILKRAKALYDTLKPYAPLFAGLTVAITTFTAVVKIQKTIEGITKAFEAWKAVTQGVTIAQKILNATLLANPIALLITAVVTLAAGFVYLYKTNEGFRMGVQKVWTSIKEIVIDAADAVIKKWNDAMLFFSNMWESTKQTFNGVGKWMKEAPGNAADFVKAKWHDVQNFFGDVWTSIKNGGADAVQSVKDTWSGIKQWFVDLWQGIKDTAIGAWESLTGAVMPYLMPLVYGIQDVFSHMSNALGSIWNGLISIGKDVFTILKNVILAPMLFVTSLISDGWEEAKNNMIAVWDNLMTAAYSLSENLKTMLSAVWTEIKDAFISLWEGMAGSFKLIWTDIKLFFINLWTSIKQGAIQLWIDIKINAINAWNDFKQSAVDTWTGIKNWFSDTWQSIKANAAKTWQDIKTSAADTWRAMLDGAVNSWNALKDFTIKTAKDMADGAQKAWDALKRGVKEMIDSVFGFFNDLKNIDLFEVGGNIIDGLINGIKQKWQDLKDSIKGIASNIKDWLKGALDIHSPSRWMRDMIGKNIVLGVVQGIENEQGTLDNAVRNMADLPMEVADIKINRSESNRVEQGTKVSTAQSQNKPEAPTEIHLHLTAYGDLPDSALVKMGKKLVKEITRQMQRDADATGGMANA